MLCVVAGNIVAQDLPTTTNVQAQQNADKQLKIQNKKIITMFIERMGNALPKKIDEYTTLESMTSKDLTLMYNFSIKTDKKDEDIINEDHTRMTTFVTKGVCKSSQRFLKSDIEITYNYSSAKSKKKLFQIDITKKDCFYIWGGRDKLPSK